jgi:hypothetical protein
MQVGAVYVMKGGYAVAGGDVILQDPIYHAVEPDFSEKDVRMAFRVNGKRWESFLGMFETN